VALIDIENRKKTTKDVQRCEKTWNNCSSNFHFYFFSDTFWEYSPSIVSPAVVTSPICTRTFTESGRNTSTREPNLIIPNRSPIFTVSPSCKGQTIRRARKPAICLNIIFPGNAEKIQRIYIPQTYIFKF